MPYKSEKIRLSEKQDRRRKLTSEQRTEIVQLYGTGLYSSRALAKRFGVSKSLILMLVNPARAAAARKRNQEHWRDYAATSEERAAIMREHRQYKHELYKSGKLGKEN